MDDFRAALRGGYVPTAASYEVLILTAVHTFPLIDHPGCRSRHHFVGVARQIALAKTAPLIASAAAKDSAASAGSAAAAGSPAAPSVRSSQLAAARASGFARASSAVTGAGSAGGAAPSSAGSNNASLLEREVGPAVARLGDQSIDLVTRVTRLVDEMCRKKLIPSAVLP